MDKPQQDTPKKNQKRRTFYDPGTKRQWAIGGLVCIGIWLVFDIIIISLGGFDSLSLGLAASARLYGLHVLLLLGIFMLIFAAVIKERRPRKKKEKQDR